MNARGYSIIEIGIALAVVLLLSSVFIAVYHSYDKTVRNKEAARQIAQIETAIVNYAASHSTAQRFVEVVSIDNTNFPPQRVVVRRRLPAGRPYLPCPDITGDGYEDRVPAFSADVPLSLTLTLGVNPGVVDYDLVRYPLEAAGGCVASRGIAPWNTLDSPPFDPWGNRYSYRVAGILSNAQTGFDQHSAGGGYIIRPLFSDGDVALASAPDFDDLTATPASETGPWNIAGFQNYLAPALVCESAPCPPLPDASQLSIVAGTQATANLTLFNAQLADFDGATEVRLAAGDLVSGVPFVVVSHGENGFGAVRSDLPGYVCNPFPTANPPTANTLEEMQNAVWTPPIPDAGVSLPDGSLYRCRQVMPPQEPAFIAGINGARPHAQGRGGYDDIVGWMSASELVAALSEQGALPAAPPPPIGLEQ